MIFCYHGCFTKAVTPPSGRSLGDPLRLLLCWCLVRVRCTLCLHTMVPFALSTYVCFDPSTIAGLSSGLDWVQLFVTLFSRCCRIASPACMFDCSDCSPPVALPLQVLPICSIFPVTLPFQSHLVLVQDLQIAPGALLLPFSNLQVYAFALVLTDLLIAASPKPLNTSIVRAL